jgi:hypothetical protein
LPAPTDIYYSAVLRILLAHRSCAACVDMLAASPPTA